MTPGVSVDTLLDAAGDDIDSLMTLNAKRELEIKKLRNSLDQAVFIFMNETTLLKERVKVLEDQVAILGAKG